MRKCAALLTMIALTGCARPGETVVTAINTLCTSTTRYHATEPQAAAFRADRLLWEPLVNWLLGFNKVRAAECLKPVPGA